MNQVARNAFVVNLLSALLFALPSSAAESQTDWERTLATAKKEGTVVVGVPASSELRTAISAKFKEKFGIPIELMSARGPENVTRIITEFNAGVRYFDILVAGGATPLSMVAAGAADDFQSYMILPEVKDPKNWWGGHVFMDNVSSTRLFYSFIATKTTEGFWYNTTLAKPDELRSLDDFLDPKWKGKIGLSDPRVPGSGLSVWSYLWDIKGEDYLKKLVQQDLFVTQNLRQLAEALAKAKVALTLGIGVAQTEPFVKAGLPVKSLPEPREGTPSSNGYGSLAILKNPPHPNAAKVFVNWLLSKDGQELYSRALLHGTRRLDVDTKWMVKEGVEAAKDYLSVKDNERLRNYLEDKCVEVRMKSQKFAEKILQ